MHIGVVNDHELLPGAIYFLGLIRAKAEQQGCCEEDLQAQFDPLAAQLLNLLSQDEPGKNFH